MWFRKKSIVVMTIPFQDAETNLKDYRYVVKKLEKKGVIVIVVVDGVEVKVYK